jgi:OHCU decarboxylase
VQLEAINAMSKGEAELVLRTCCGSTGWAAMMAAARPFISIPAMLLTGDVIWSALGLTDWLEAFAAHPRIGERPAPASPTAAWSSEEQSGVAADSRARFEQLNRDYEARFGFVFIVRAAGRSAAEIAAILERRMRNNPDDELHEAAEEQRQITRLRLTRLLT